MYVENLFIIFLKAYLIVDTTIFVFMEKEEKQLFQ